MNRYEEHGRPSQNVFGMIEERSGRTATAVFCTISLWYFLAHTAVFARLWTELLRAYLAPGALTAALCVLPILAGLIYLNRGRGFYLRAGRYLECLLFVLCASFVWLAGEQMPTGTQMPAETLYGGTADSGRLGAMLHGIAAGLPEITAGGREIALALLLLAGLLLAVAGGIRCVRAVCDYLLAAGEEFFRGQAFRRMRERFREVRKKAGGISGAKIGANTDAGISGTSVANGMITETQKLCQAELADELSVQPEYYGIRMEKKLSGLPDIGKIRFYGGKIAGELSATRISWWIVVLALYALTVGFADTVAVITFYRAYNLQILIPVLLALYVYMLLSPLFGSGKGKSGTDNSRDD